MKDEGLGVEEKGIRDEGGGGYCTLWWWLPSNRLPVCALYILKVISRCGVRDMNLLPENHERVPDEEMSDMPG